MRALACLFMISVFWSDCGLRVQGAEARISFQVKGAWVNFTLEKDAFPVPEAIVQVVGPSGEIFAEGTTGANGQGQFPLPSWEQFQVEIAIGKRSANTINLSRIGNSVLPNEVLLSYGSKPCCKIESISIDHGVGRLTSAAGLDVSVWAKLVAGAFFSAGVAYLACYARLPAGAKTTMASRRRKHG